MNQISDQDEKAMLKSINVSDDEQEIDDSFKDGDAKILLSAKETTKLKKKSKTVKDKSIPGVIYLGRIPHGFYEEEMLGYFSQFGTVSRLRLARNKKTGHSKHYAFIEFDNEEVAKIVAETMDNYLLFNHILQCKLIPREKIHKDLFKGSEKPFKALPWSKIHRERHNKQYEASLAKLIEKEDLKRQKMALMGIEYEFGGYKEEREKRKVPDNTNTDVETKKLKKQDNDKKKQSKSDEKPKEKVLEDKKPKEKKSKNTTSNENATTSAKQTSGKKNSKKGKGK